MYAVQQCDIFVLVFADYGLGLFLSASSRFEESMAFGGKFIFLCLGGADLCFCDDLIDPVQLYDGAFGGSL